MSEANCPNCGAPIRKPVCEYCGTLLADGGLVDHDITELYSGNGLVMVIDTPKPSKELLEMVARGLITEIEAQRFVYG